MSRSEMLSQAIEDESVSCISEQADQMFKITMDALNHGLEEKKTVLATAVRVKTAANKIFKAAQGGHK